MNRKIALLNDTFPPNIDGVANTVYNYAKILNPEDEITVITPYYPNVHDVYDFKVDRYFSFPTSEKIGYRVGIPMSPENIKYFFKKNRFDIIHVHSPFASGVLSRIIKRKNSVLIVTYHTKYEEDFEKRLKSKFMKTVATKFIRSNIKACDEVWTVSEGAAESLRALGYNGKYVVMPNGTDMPKGRAPKSHIDLVCAKYGIPDGIPLVLFVGRMMWYKNVKLTLDACKAAKEKGLPFYALFVGDGYDRTEMIKYAADLGISELTSFPGATNDRADIYALYSRATILSFPSSYDTSGLVVKEAAACSCPSILLKDSCAAEGVVDGFTGFLASEETSEAVAEQLIKALSDLDKTAEIGKNASEHIYISWEDSVKRASHRYDELLKEKRGKKSSFFRKKSE